ncbi:hypothetical protein COH20_010697 [Aspergillus flavus]|nr:hypothetical protein COH20_010697 [Aspergillus flavus]
MAATYAGPPLANGLQPLSCLRCAHRKVRCDRVVHCSTCIRHNAVCDFPQPKTEKCQRRKVAVASPSSRNKLRTGLDRGGITHSPRQKKTPSRETIDAAVAPNGQLIVMGKRSRYVEGDLWTRIGQELNDGAMFPDSSSNKEDDEEVASDTQVGYKASALALRLSPQTPSIESYYPTKQHFRILWPIYLSNIRPVTMILHAPSAGEKLTKAVEGHGNASRIAVTDVRNFDMCPHVCHGC